MTYVGVDVPIVSLRALLTSGLTSTSLATTHAALTNLISGIIQLPIEEHTINAFAAYTCLLTDCLAIIQLKADSSDQLIPSNASSADLGIILDDTIGT